MSNLLESVMENLTFVLEFAAVIVCLFLVAVIFEKIMSRRVQGEKISGARKIAVVGMFSAISAILMLFEFPIPFAPPFYELDFSELPILIGSFAFGPVAGVTMEFIKIVLKLFLKGTSTAFVGDLANFVVGCSFILPASMLYYLRKTKKTAILSCILGTMVLAVFGTAFNAIYLIPAFSVLFGMPMESIIQMGMEVNPLVSEGSIVSFVVACVAPMNLLKGGIVSLLTLLIYKHISPILKARQS